MPEVPAPTAVYTDTVASTSLLAGILASAALDEIAVSHPDDDEKGSIGRYLDSPSGGRAREGKLMRGVIFWAYPTGTHGPDETLEEGDSCGTADTVLERGLLVTVQRGADAQETKRWIMEAVPDRDCPLACLGRRTGNSPDRGSGSRRRRFLPILSE
ncbi:hypothetical protein DFH09DRAFT_1169892 [Mycena vulgaris]|nr:hypothetical protein DFH09DRAFT_1169892 [Mycena vulgaris]